jgi:ATP-binding cassette subfamily B protein
MNAHDEATEEDFGKRFDPALWKRLLGYVFRYRKTAVRFALGAGLLGIVETGFPILNQMLIDEVAQRREEVDLVAYGAVYLGLTLALAFFIWLFVYCGGRMRTHVAHDIRKDAFANLQELSFSYYDLRPVGWLMARMTSDCDRLSQILAWGLMDCVWGFTMMTAIATAMFLFNAKLALAVIVVVPLLAWISGWFQVRILKTSRKVRKTNSKLTAAYNEGIMGIRTSKVFVRENRNLGEFRGLAGEMYGDSVKNALLNAAYLPIVLTITSLAIGLTLAVGGVQVVGGAISIGTLIMFMGFARLFFQPVQELSAWFAELQMAQASAERIIGLIETVPEIRDSEEVVAAAATHPPEFGSIEFRGVGFCYRGGARVLENFDLKVAAGETVALVGATGGGKTTIVNLLCRFYEPTEGSILFDGVDYRKRSLEWLHGNLGIVLQQPHLFRGSVRENIRYGRLDATDDEVEEAARVAGAHDFVSALEEGYGTDVGEGGNRLSGGQRQLVSLARAILARPRILVMDEATSSVDTETEQRIQAGVERVLEGRTSFVIAHRLSTIRRADRILVIEKGRIVEQGSHAELLERQGAYYDLYMQQSLRDAVRLDAAWAEEG